MPQSHSVPPQIQLVQMADRPIPWYDRLEINPGGLPRLSLALLAQGRVEAADQRLFRERLGQETTRSRLQCLLTGILGSESRDENERHPISLGKQVRVQFETAHRGHPNIGDHARGVIPVRRAQELRGGFECMNDVAKRPHEIVGGGANGSVIVDD